MKPNNEIKVSISTITFNHVNYIKQCLDGFLMQKTDFNFEVLIHDDASTDGTEDIIKEYTEKYPNLIFPLYETENQWSKGRRGSIVFNYPRAKGKYIALCEGDDYWTDPYKLQKQVDFLESNNTIVASFTNALIRNEIIDKDYKFVKKLSEGIVTSKDIIIRGGGIYPTASFVFKKRYIDNVFFYDLLKTEGMYGDEALIFFLMDAGHIYFHDITTVVYRRWSGGVYSLAYQQNDKLVELRKKSIINYQVFSKKLNKKYSKYFKQKISSDSLYILNQDNSIKRFNYFFNINFFDFIKYYYRRIKLKFH